MIAPVENLIESLVKLPSIGRKSAMRLAMYLLEESEDLSSELAEALYALKRDTKLCSKCHNYIDNNGCPVCRSPKRDDSVVCVVEKPADVYTIEETGRYKGMYHVVGGVLSPINGVTAEHLNIESLVSRIESESFEEIIIGLGGSAEAETTALYISRRVKDTGVRITRFARGLPAGLELDQVDRITLDRALEERIDM